MTTEDRTDAATIENLLREDRTFPPSQSFVDGALLVWRLLEREGRLELAEHGVGRSPVKQTLLRQLYGEAGIDQMRAVKLALDPDWKLAPGVLFSQRG